MQMLKLDKLKSYQEGEEVNMFKRGKKNQVIQAAARKLITSSNLKAAVSEQFRTLRTNINFSMPDQELKTILYTSASPGEGKSTVAANTAIVFGQEGKKVLLIDADMRKPTVHYTFHMTNTLGLSNLLTRQATLAEVTKKSDIEQLDIITCGPIPPNPAELLGSKAMSKLIEEMKEQYDVIIFDAPPVLLVTDSQILANLCEATILVLSAGKSEKESVLKAKVALDTAKANIIGAILNNFEMSEDYEYYGTEGIE